MLHAVRRFAQRSFASGEYDLAIIGGGPGGYVAALKAGQKGLKTVCVEKRGALGGTCLNVGCIPTKALLTATHELHKAKHMFPKLGIKCDQVTYDFAQIMKHKQDSVTSLTRGLEGLFKKNKVDYVKGTGTFTSKNDIAIALNGGGKDSIRAKNIIIATGSEVSEIPGTPVKLDEKVVVSSTGALSLPKVPKKMLVVGGGVIGLELGSVYSRLGTEVIVIEYMDKILPPCDDEICTALQKLLKNQGIKFMTGYKVVSGSVGSSGAKLTVENVKSGQRQELEGEIVLAATGRRPFTEQLNCKEIGINMDKMGRVDIGHEFQTSIPNIFAIGDVVKGPMLAHKAEEEGFACVENIIKEGGHVNYEAIPSVVYTSPEIAGVGKTEQELIKEKVQYKKGTFPYLANGRAKTMLETDGFVKVLADKKTDKILGFHIIGSNAGEAIAEAGLAMEYGASAEDVARTCHAHPTMSEALKEACLAAYDKALHI